MCHPLRILLRSLSDLPGLILQVAGTPMHGVLVLVSKYRPLCILEYSYRIVLVHARIIRSLSATVGNPNRDSAPHSTNATSLSCNNTISFSYTRQKPKSAKFELSTCNSIENNIKFVLQPTFQMTNLVWEHKIDYCF